MIFSIIVPFFNEELHIARCTESLLNQNFDPGEYEVIFIDNNSTDASLKVVEGYSHVLCLREERQGAYAARNRALAIAKGRIVAFTDADCQACPDWLAQIYEGMQRTSAAIVVGKRSVSPNASLTLRLFEAYDNAKIEYVLNQPQKKYCFGFTNNMAVKADIFKDIGAFLEIPRGADTEFVQRYLARYPEGRIAYLPDMRITHLELEDWRAIFNKARIYEQSNRFIQKISYYRILDWQTRLKILSYCIRKKTISHE